jgi:hypothetical protein
MLAPASYAQDLRPVPYAYAYAGGIYGDCYYDISLACAPGTYAAVTTTTPFGAYAAINGVVRQPYLTGAPFYWRGLRGGDWVAIHGSNGSR